jgi:hypothetical protein
MGMVRIFFRQASLWPKFNGDIEPKTETDLYGRKGFWLNVDLMGKSATCLRVTASAKQGATGAEQNYRSRVQNNPGILK